MIDRARLLIATLWVGSLWAIGYFAAPTLFATLYDRALAGTVAGSLFRTEAWASIACGLLLLGLNAWAKRGREGRVETLLILSMLACTLVGYFCLQPFMAALRESAGPGGVMASDARTEFGALHGASMLIYLVGSLLGGALILKQKR
jgi:hypothetical protein